MNTRAVTGLAVFGLVACASYAIQRVVDAQTEAPAVAVIAQAHIPYYWRVGMALLHGGALGLIAGVGLPVRLGERFVGALPWAVLAVVVPAVALMVAFP